MLVEFVNHASVIYKFDDIALMADPWIEGTVFQNGWGQISKTPFQYSDFSKITHIWFSHEHPDHFFPPNIKKIPEECRKNITVLFRTTLDKKVVKFCENLKFKRVVEIPDNNWEAIDGIELICMPWYDDSALAIRHQGKVLLNTNDCVLDRELHIRRIRDLVGSDVELLLTQFSYASFTGETFEERKASADKKLKQISEQITGFNARFVIPFASFVWFCHEENVRLNDAVNRVDRIYEHIQTNHPATKAVVLYPGDRWKLGTDHSSELALNLYLKDMDNSLGGALVKTVPVSFDEVMAASDVFREKLKKNVDYLFLLKMFNVLKPVRIFLSDINKAVELTANGLRPLNASKEECEISMSAEVIAFCLKLDFGFNTTLVNGRFHLLKPSGYARLQPFVSISDALNNGRLSFQELFKAAWRRLKSRLE